MRTPMPPTRLLSFSRAPLRAFTLVELPAVSSVRRAAFTLVELLVVIGVIGVLVGILLPALAAARRSAYSVKCLNNLRQIATGATIHANRHKGYYPLAGHL